MTKEEQDKLLSGGIGGSLGFLLAWLLKGCPVGAACPPYTLYVEYIEQQGDVGWSDEPYDIPINVHIDNRADYAQEAEVWLQAGNDIYTQQVVLQPGMNTVTFTIRVTVTYPERFDLNMTASIAAASSVLHCGGGG